MAKIRADEYWNPKAETMPVKELKELQLGKIKYIVNYAYATSPFYRRRFDEAKVKPEDIKTFDDFRKRIPIFRKDDVRAEMEKTGDLFWGNRTVPLENILQVTPSTGTTGIPTPGYASRDDLELISECDARNLWMHGLRPNMKALMFSMHWHWNTYHWAGMRNINPKTIMFMQGPLLMGVGMENWVETALRFKPDWIIAPMDMIIDINGICERKGISPKDFSIKYISGGIGEAVTPLQRKDTIERWGVEDLFEASGVGDLTWAIRDCFAHEGMHAWDDVGYSEIVDPETNEPLQPGERGEWVATTFFKSQPFIRYGTEDYGDLTIEPCACGRTHTRFRPYTRTGWLTKIAGKRIDPYSLRVILEGFPETSDASFSIIREAKEMDKLKFQAVYDAKMTKDPEELKNRIREVIKREMGVDAEITWVTWEELPKILHKIRRIVDV
jgi:phenylacetate-CoA ligase